VRKQEIVMQSEALGSPFDPVAIGTQTWVAQATHPQYV
jgi:hypothetical protein